MLENQLPLRFCAVLAYPRGARFTTGEPCGIQKWYQGEPCSHHAARSAEELSAWPGRQPRCAPQLFKESEYIPRV